MRKCCCVVYLSDIVYPYIKLLFRVCYLLIGISTTSANETVKDCANSILFNFRYGLDDNIVFLQASYMRIDKA